MRSQPTAGGRTNPTTPLGTAVSPEHLKTGTNTIAVYSNIAYDDSTKAPYGQVDCVIEGLEAKGLGVKYDTDDAILISSD
jgi:hypothetical protein